MAGLGAHHAESQGSQPEDHFERLERRRDREGSVHSEYPGASHTPGGASNTHDDGSRAMQEEIDRLKRKLRRSRRKPSPSLSSPSSGDDGEGGYDSETRSPPSSTSSGGEDDPPARKRKRIPSRGLSNDAMSRALHQLSKSPFSRRIEKGRLPRRFTQPTFTIYNGRTDPVEHVSHFNQRMAIHSHNETLMCKVFPSSLGPVAMRWFNGLKSQSISSFGELTRSFASRFITCSRVPRPLDSLLSMTMKEGETLKTYSDRYWEMFNEIDGDFDEVALNTFKVGLPTDHDLRKSLTKKPVRSVRRLMDRVDEYKRVEEDQQQGKGKEKVIPQERRDFRSDRYNNSRPRRDYSGQSNLAAPQAVNTVFREPVHQLLEKVRKEPFFRWPSKMVGDPAKRNQNLFCQYHQDVGHTTENCRTLWNHLEQLVSEGKLKQHLCQPAGQGSQVASNNQRNNSSRPALGTINVIFAAPGRTGSGPTRVMAVSHSQAEGGGSRPKRPKVILPVLGFTDEDKAGTIQPHDDALVVTLRIGNYDVRR